MTRGLTIILHALRMLLHDPRATLRVTSPGVILILGSVVLGQLLWGNDMRLLFAGDETVLARVSGGAILGALLLSLLGLIGYVLMAVYWHRYVLMGDPTQDSAIRPTARTLGRYIWCAILVGLAQALALIPLSLVMGLGGAAFGWTGSTTPLSALIMGLLIGIAALWLALRISVILPAAAVEDKMTLRQSWQVTAPIAGDIFWVAALLSLVSVGVLALMQAIFTAPSAVAVAVETLVFLAEALVAISVLTTLYGHLVERRPLH